MGRKVRAKLKPYNGLNDNFTQVANSMLSYIKDPYAFKIYFYLCMRYNTEYDYAFPSLTTIFTFRTFSFSPLFIAKILCGGIFDTSSLYS